MAFNGEVASNNGPQLAQFFFRRFVSLHFIACEQLRPGHAVHLSPTEDCPSHGCRKVITFGHSPAEFTDLRLVFTLYGLLFSRV
jgi:hypothetical protein